MIRTIWVNRINLKIRHNGRVRYLLTSVLTHFEFDKRGKATKSRHWVIASNITQKY